MPIIRSLVPFLDKPEYTALELAEEVLDIIEEEPRRVDQTNWCVLVPKSAAPCGTRACMAGWTVQLAFGDVFRFMLGDIPRLARMLLAGPEEYSSPDYDEWTWEDHKTNERQYALQSTFGSYHGEDWPAGSVEHMQEASGPFRAWIANNREFLAARILTPEIRAQMLTTVR